MSVDIDYVDKLNLAEEIVSRDKQIADLLTQNRVALERWASMVCPLKVGDIVAACGYTHEGRQCVVKSVFGVRYNQHRYEWKIHATLLKKDGSESVIRTSFSQSQWEKTNGVHSETT
jgi:acetone carboxylase gamma subunit